MALTLEQDFETFFLYFQIAILCHVWYVVTLRHKMDNETNRLCDGTKIQTPLKHFKMAILRM